MICSYIEICFIGWDDCTSMFQLVNRSVIKMWWFWCDAQPKYITPLYIYIHIFLMVYIFSFSILYCLLAAESSHVWPFFSTFHLFSRWPRINPGGGLLFRVNQWLRNPLDQCGHQHRRSSAAAGVLRATTRASAADLVARHALGSVSAETPRKGPSFGLCGDWAMTKVHKK